VDRDKQKEDARECSAGVCGWRPASPSDRVYTVHFASVSLPLDGILHPLDSELSEGLLLRVEALPCGVEG
jgi:hypothetical protein